MQEQIEQELQDLRDQLEYSQLEAQLLANQAEERNSDDSSRHSSLKSHKGGRSVCEKLSRSNPNELVETLPEQVMADKQSLASSPNICEQSTSPRPLYNADDDKVELEASAVLLEMNQQLVNAMKPGNETTSVMKAILQRQGIPKPQPTKFRGDPAKFPIFKARVDAWVNERDLEEKEKITRLLSLVEGDARDAIEHCELKSNGYTEAMKILETQYGHPSCVVKASLTRITSGPRIDKGDKDAITKLRNNLRASLEVLKDNENYEHEINASSNVERVIDRLPMHMQIEWAKKVPKIRDETKLNPTLRHVMEFIERQLRSMNDPQYGHILTAKRKATDGNSSKGNAPNALSRKPILTLTTSLDKLQPCPCCKGKHVLTNCENFAKKTPEERWEIVRTLKLCHLCLASGHMKAQCKSTVICRCKATHKHHRLLHRRISPPKDDCKPQSNDHKPLNSIKGGLHEESEKTEMRPKPELPKSDAKDNEQ